MSEVEITCINKDGGNHENPHEGITHYGWHSYINNKSDRATREAMVKYIEDGNNAYVSNGSSKVYCYINKSSYGRKFLQTKADGVYTNNLLSLQECKI